MRRHVMLLSLLVLTAAACLGCGGGADAEAVKTYADDTLPPLREILNAALERYDNISGGNFVDEATTYETVRDMILPGLKELVLQAEAVHPATADVTRVHDSFLAAVRRYVSAFQLFLLSLDQQNMANTAVALEELEEAHILRRTFEQRFEDVCGEYGIVPGVPAPAR